MRLPFPLCLTLAAALGLACASAQQQTTYLGGPLPRPDRIMVYDYAVTPSEVKLDRGLSARAMQALEGTSRTQSEIDTGHKVAAALSEHLVERINDMGLHAERASGPLMQAGDDVIVNGHFLSIDEGNRTERVVIGLGLGRSDVKTETQVYQNGGLVEQFATDAHSGYRPGAAETMGAGAAVGNLAASAVVSAGVAGASETFGVDVEADADRTAKALAESLKKFFVRQGWIED